MLTPYRWHMAVSSVRKLHRSAFLTAQDDQPRARRAADITTVVVGALLVIWGLFAYHASDPLQETLADFAAALPEWAVALLALAYTLGLLLALVIAILFIARRRWAALRDVVVAGIVASAAALVCVSIFGELWPAFFNEFSQGEVRPQFPVMRVALVAAVLVAATPYLARPLRRFGWALVVVMSFAAIALALSVPSGAVCALGIGMICGSGVLLIFGSPRGYPDVTAVREALQQIGLDIPDLAISHDQSWGVRRLTGSTPDGTAVLVKAYGRDATDSQLMAKVWHTLMYRGRARSWTASRLQSVEHEALVTLLAQRAGVPTVDVLAAADANDEVAVLVTTNAGTALADLEPASIDEDKLRELWRNVGALHRANITHGGLSGHSVRLADDGFLLTNFANGSVVYRESAANLDVVHLLFATAALLTAEQAVSIAVDGLGKDKLAQCLGYLQPPALSASERRAVKGSSKLLNKLRDLVAEATETTPEKPVKIRRVDRRTIIMLVLVCMFASAFIPLLTDVDYSAIWDSLANATWWLAIIAVLLGQVAFIPQGTAMMCAVGRAIPLRPMTILQPAVAFISFAVPGMAGRVTMESAFLYKFGIAPAVSVTKGALDAFSGFLVQCVILVVALLTGALILPASTSSGSSESRSFSPWLLVLVLALAIVAFLVVTRVDRIRSRVIPEIKNAWHALTEVASSPRLAFGLIGSQIAVQFLWGMALWVALFSMGVHLNLISCMAVVVATSLLQGIIPVPGGIGVSEAVMAAFLTPLGVPGDVALGAVIIWRVATFYLPACEGFVAMKYLERRGYL